MSKFYKNIDQNLYEVKGNCKWFISAKSKEDALGLANKRGEFTEDDIIFIGTGCCSTIFGTSDKYEEVINMWDKLDAI
jgi:hypothetical protein